MGCAVGGAACFGLACVVQERATKVVPWERALHPRLLVRLFGQPTWLAGLVVMGLGLVLQIVALASGPVALVQPIGVTSALFGAVFGALAVRGRLSRSSVVGALLCAGGLGVFLLVARPTAPVGGVGAVDVGSLFVLTVALVLAAVLVSTMGGGAVRVLAIATAAGICYGVTAALLKVITVQVRDGGVLAPFSHWAVYAVCVLGPPGFLLSQNAFQQGRKVSAALAVITTVDPLVAVAVGVGWLGERVAVTPAALAGELVGAAAIAVGVTVLLGNGRPRRQGGPVEKRGELVWL